MGESVLERIGSMSTRRVLSCLLAALLLVGSSGCKKKNRGPAFQAEHLVVGPRHACAWMKDGSVACWGDGARRPTRSPADQARSRDELRDVPGVPGAKAVATGPDHACAIAADD